MGLLSNPQVVNDGTADHTYVYRGQLPSPKSLVSEYFEPAAISSDSKLTSKYDLSNSPAQRSVISTTKMLPDAEGVLKKCTINTSVAYDKGCSIADVEDLTDLHCATLNIPGVRTRFLQRQP